MEKKCPNCKSTNIKIKYPSENVLKCFDCSLLFRGKIPSTKTLELFYNTAFSNYIKHPNNIYTQRQSSVEAPSMLSPYDIDKQLVMHLEKSYGQIKSKKILDFGAGVGQFSSIAKERGALVVTIEKNTIAQKIIRDQGILSYTNIEDLQKNCIHKEFDFIVLIEVLEHLLNPLNGINNLIDLLAPNGRFFITTPNAGGGHARIRKNEWHNIQNESHLFFFNYRSLEQLCLEAGLFKIERVNWHIRWTNNPFRRAIHELMRLLKLSSLMVVCSR